MSREYTKFKGVSISKNLYLDPKPIEEQLRVKLNIILRHAPCAILSLDILDDLRHHQVDINIPKKKITLDGTFIEDVR